MTKVIKCKVKYYGIIRDILGVDDEIIEYVGMVPTLYDIRGVVEKINPDMKEVAYLFAVNHELVSDIEKELKDNDEVALLPAFAGG